jgi:hypothetical protein
MDGGQDRSSSPAASTSAASSRSAASGKSSSPWIGALSLSVDGEDVDAALQAQALYKHRDAASSASTSQQQQASQLRPQSRSSASALQSKGYADPGPASNGTGSSRGSSPSAGVSSSNGVAAGKAGSPPGRSPSPDAAEPSGRLHVDDEDDGRSVLDGLSLSDLDLPSHVQLPPNLQSLLLHNIMLNATASIKHNIETGAGRSAVQGASGCVLSAVAAG